MGLRKLTTNKASEGDGTTVELFQIRRDDVKCNAVCAHFEKEECRQIQKAPFVCNGCDKPRHKCSIQTKYNYNAKAADRMYHERLTDARSGINMTKKELLELDAVVKPLIWHVRLRSMP